MSRDKSKTLEWGSANRPKISNKLGIPNSREGSDGDIQVRQTGMGARLFAKLGGRWLSNILYGSELDSPDVFVPKCWTKVFTLPGDGSTTTLGFAPNYITAENILGASVIIQGANFYIFSLCLDSGALETYVPYNHMFYFDAGDTKAIKCVYVNSLWRGFEARVTIFFK